MEEKTEKIYSFAAGAATLPDDLKNEVYAQMLSFGKTGDSILEIPCTSSEYQELYHETENSLRRLVGIPPNYKVLFLPSGANEQFSAVPMNLLSDHKCADYIITGKVSDMAMKEAKKYGDVAIAASSSGANPCYSAVPFTERSDFRPDADYVHITTSDSTYGTKFYYLPDTGTIPLVADMTNAFLSEPIDVSKYGLIYAGPQGNTTSCGFTVVIIREDLCDNARSDTPTALNYKILSDDLDMYKPHAFGLLMAKNLFDFMQSNGGLEQAKRRNERKASTLYDYLDDQRYYSVPVDKKSRSTTNIIFTTNSRTLDAKFIEDAKLYGLYNLEGHPSIGGMRASI